MLNKPLLAFACLALVTAPSFAKKEREYEQAQTTVQSKTEEPWLKVQIQPGERDIIKRYYTEHPEALNQGEPIGKKKKNLPPGLKKKLERGGELPPGWQKKVARGEVMSDEVYYQSRPLSKEVIKLLPPPPPGTVVVVIQGKVVRLVEATRTIIDVFDLH